MKIKYAKFEINNSCNLNCPYCFLDEDLQVMSMKQQLDSIDKLLDMGVTHIDFFGKEPLLSMDRIACIISYVKSLLDSDVTFSLITNGLLLDNNKELIQGIPLESITVSYDPSFISRPRIPYLSDTMREIKESGKITQLTIDLHKGNIDATINMLRKIPLREWVDEIFFNPIMPQWNNDNSRYCISEQQYGDFVAEARVINLEGVAKIFSIPNDFYVTLKKYSNMTQEDLFLDQITYNVFYAFEPFCSAGKEQIYVRADGMAFGCVEASFNPNNPYKCNLLTTPAEKVIELLSCPNDPRRQCYIKECSK